MMAAVVPISLAATSVSKLLVFIFALVVLAAGIAQGRRFPELSRLRTTTLILLMLAALALSLAYTTAPRMDALKDLAKYGKLLVIPLVLVLVRTRREAMTGLALYGVAQFMVVVTSYLLTMVIELPWVIKTVDERVSVGTVYSSYLDQSIMTAGLAAVCWNLRHEFPGRMGPFAAVAVAVVCSVNVLFFLPGRSGQAALLAAFALTLFWNLPRRARLASLFAPVLLVAFAMAVSPAFKDRIGAVVTDSTAYKNGDHAATSSGLRLNFWQRSIEAIAENPLVGTGVGSWNTEYRRLEGDGLNPAMITLRNPHQEYLMWGVQLGVGGIVLLLGFMLAMVRDTMGFRPEVRHATHTMVGMLAVVCLFNSTIFDALIGDYFCVMIGLLLALGLHAPQPQRETTA